MVMAPMKFWMMLIGPVAAIITWFALYWGGQASPIAWTAAVVVLCAIWWIFEPVPIPVTSLIPLAVLPLVGVLKAEQVGAAYGDSLVLLMMGGFMLSMAMERSGAHRRIALTMVHAFGGQQGGRQLVFGFMAASAFLSMWISNAATTLMLLPIATAALEKSSSRQLKQCLLLGRGLRRQRRRDRNAHRNSAESGLHEVLRGECGWTGTDVHDLDDVGAADRHGDVSRRWVVVDARTHGGGQAGDFRRSVPGDSKKSRR